jgi:RND family efflux transporter MFP subunit
MNKMALKEAQASDTAVSQAIATEKAAKVRQGYATIVAPFSGVITARSIDPGDMASPGAPILTIEDRSVFRLETKVPAKDIKYIQPGMKIRLEIGSGKVTGTGIVSVISPAGDPATRKFLVKIDIPKSLDPSTGDFGMAGIKVGKSKGIAIPKDAIHDNGGILNVFAVGAENRADMRIIRIGREMAEGVEVTTGLNPGDRIIIKSELPLTDDMPISPEEVRQ